MAFLEIKNVRVAGLSAGVPSRVVSNADGSVTSADYEAEAFIETTGVRERHISDELTTSDLCYAAAEKLISDLQWDKSEIDALIFVSQNADYFVPATSCILQDRLGLSKDCYITDISLGCSGWVYGMSTIASLVATGSIKKALMMAGDARRHVPTYDPLFGFAGTVTALEFKEGAPSMYFHFGTDGSGFDAIIIPDGGCRNQIKDSSFDTEIIEGREYNRLQPRMKGMDVFSFGITVAPKSIKKISERFGFDYHDCDYYVFHQANMKMNNFIAKKLKLDSEKVPSSLERFGNTSSASIPLTIVTQLQKECMGRNTKFLGCGFGVGLSWGTIVFETDSNLVISDLVKVDDDQTDKQHVV